MYKVVQIYTYTYNIYIYTFSTLRNSHSLKTLVFLHIGDWYGAVVLLGEMVGKLTHSNALSSVQLCWT